MNSLGYEKDFIASNPWFYIVGLWKSRFRVEVSCRTGFCHEYKSAAEARTGSSYFYYEHYLCES